MILPKSFYEIPAYELAPKLLGKYLVRQLDDGNILKYRITETEAYYSESDTACHAKAGITKRTKPMYEAGGITYIYLCYGIHYLLNIVSGPADHPEAVLIRGIENYDGPGKLTKALTIDKSLNYHDITKKEQLWIEDNFESVEYTTSPRIGIDYAAEPCLSKHWRFIIKEDL